MGFDKQHYGEMKKLLRRACDQMMRSRLPGLTKAILYHISTFAKPCHNCEWSWISQTLLMARTGKSKPTIIKHLKMLAELGIIQIHKGKPVELSAMLGAEYGEGLTSIKTKKQVSLYRLCLGHSVWTKGELTAEDLGTMKRLMGVGPEALERFRKARERVGE